MMNTVDESEIEGSLLNYSVTMQQVTPDQLKFYKSNTLSATKCFLGNLKKFLGPLHEHLTHFCFFEHFKSDFFRKFMTRNLDNVQHTCYNLSKICDSALSYVHQTVQGDVTLSKLGLDLCKNTREEISNFEKFVTEKDKVHVECRGQEGFDALMLLTKIHEGVPLLKDVCETFELENCIQDQTLQKLSEFSNRLQIPEDISLKDAFDMRKNFEEAFPNRKGEFNVYFNLFKELKSSFKYVEFLRIKGFIGEGGKIKFSEERNLITQEIQDTLEQRILDDLWDAYSTLSHFLDHQVTYHTLTLGLEKLHNVEKCTLQIKALQKHTIRQLDTVFALIQVSWYKPQRLFTITSIIVHNYKFIIIVIVLEPPNQRKHFVSASIINEFW